MKIIAYPDISGLAPASECWIAIDDDTYDGAEDSKTRNQIGQGSSPTKAIANLMEILDQ